MPGLYIMGLSDMHYYVLHSKYYDPNFINGGIEMQR